MKECCIHPALMPGPACALFCGHDIHADPSEVAEMDARRAQREEVTDPGASVEPTFEETPQTPTVGPQLRLKLDDVQRFD